MSARERLRFFVAYCRDGIERLKTEQPDMPDIRLAFVAKGPDGGKVGPMWDHGSFLDDIDELLEGGDQ